MRFQETAEVQGRARHAERVRAQRQLALRLCDDPALATSVMRRDVSATRALLREAERGTGWDFALAETSAEVIAPSWRPSEDTLRALARAGDRTFLTDTTRDARLVTSCPLSEWPAARVVSAMPAIPGTGYALAPHVAKPPIAALRDASDRIVADLAPEPPADGTPALLRSLDAWTIAAIALGVLLAIASGARVASASRRSLEALESAATWVARGNLEPTTLSTRGGVPRADETLRAMVAFDAMTKELRRTQRRLLRAERIAAWRDIAQRIAHEIKNPLQPIRVSMETLQRTHAKKHPDFDEIFAESSAAILEEVQRLEHIVTEFSRFARLPRPRPEEVSVAALIAHVATMHADERVLIRVDVPSDLPPIRADKDQLTQVLVNLVQNARDAIVGAPAAELPRKIPGQIVLCARATELGVEISVRDNGPGIPTPDQDRVFEPYFTTKKHGTGLGLAIASRIIGDHGGTLDMESEPGAGTEMRISLRREGPGPEVTASTSDVTASFFGRLG